MPMLSMMGFTLRDGQMNGVYFEQLCDVLNPEDQKVGYCVEELLPGVRNEKFISQFLKYKRSKKNAH